MTTSIPRQGQPRCHSRHVPVGCRLTVEAVASMELCTNIASGLPMVTLVTTELAMDIVASGLIAVSSVTAELAMGIGEEELKFTFADRSEILGMNISNLHLRVLVLLELKVAI